MLLKDLLTSNDIGLTAYAELSAACIQRDSLLLRNLYKAVCMY